jgi:hypothetical protein
VITIDCCYYRNTDEGIKMEELVGIVLFTGAAACIIVSLYLRYLTRIKRMDTIVKLAENGGDVKAEMIKMLGYEGGPTNDLRKGLVFIALSLPLLLGFSVMGRYELAERNHEAFGRDEASALTFNMSLGFSHAGVATIMQLPLGTVKSHITRGIGKLRDILSVPKTQRSPWRPFFNKQTSWLLS